MDGDNKQLKPRPTKKGIKLLMWKIENEKNSFIIAVCLFAVLTISFAIISLVLQSEQKDKNACYGCSVSALSCTVLLVGVKKADVPPPRVSLIVNPTKRMFYMFGKPTWYKNLCRGGFYFFLVMFTFYIIPAIIETMQLF